MRIKRIVLAILVIMLTAQAEFFVLAQHDGKSAKAVVGVEHQDAEAIMSQILSCPAWDEIEKGDVKAKNKIMESLAVIAENDISMIRQAMLLLFTKYPNDHSIWSRVFLLNRYIFQVSEKSPIDGKLFGGWAGVPIENGIINRLWPFSYDSQNNLQLVGEFEGYFGDGYRGLDEFDYFQKTFSLRKK